MQNAAFKSGSTQRESWWNDLFKDWIKFWVWRLSDLISCVLLHLFWCCILRKCCMFELLYRMLPWELHTVTDKDINLTHEKRLCSQNCKERLNSDQKLHHLSEQGVEKYTQLNICLLNWSDKMMHWMKSN